MLYLHLKAANIGKDEKRAVFFVSLKTSVSVTVIKIQSV